MPQFVPKRNGIKMHSATIQFEDFDLTTDFFLGWNKAAFQQNFTPQITLNVTFSRY